MTGAEWAAWAGAVDDAEKIMGTLEVMRCGAVWVARVWPGKVGFAHLGPMIGTFDESKAKAVDMLRERVAAEFMD